LEANKEYLEVLRKLSVQIVEQLGTIRIQLHDRLQPLESLNFVANTLTAALALAVEFQVEEMKGQVELDPQIDEKLVMIKGKLGEAIQAAMAELAPGDTVVRKRVEEG
jgi:hypothetical protein